MVHILKSKLVCPLGQYVMEPQLIISYLKLSGQVVVGRVKIEFALTVTWSIKCKFRKHILGLRIA